MIAVMVNLVLLFVSKAAMMIAIKFHFPLSPSRKAMVMSNAISL